MSTYECKLCNYLTNDQSNFIKHKKSIKHNKKEEQPNNSTNKIQIESQRDSKARLVKQTSSKATGQ